MGKEIWLYDILNVISALFAIAYNLMHYSEKKKFIGGISLHALEYFRSKQGGLFRSVLSALGFWVVLETLVITAVQYLSSGYFNFAFGDLMNTGANYFGLMFFAPLLVVLVCILLKIDPLAQLDLIAPAYPLALIFVKIACFFAGCCRGIAWDKGIYNPVSTLMEFPIQLLEAAMALVLFLFLLRHKGKMKKGTVFPIYLMVYSASRFFTEFLRCEPNIYFGLTLKTYQVLCIAGVLVGAAEYVIARKYDAYVRKKSAENNHL